MARLEWSSKALRHIDKIAEYIAINSEFQARRVVDRIWSRTQGLRTFPEIGAMVWEFNDPGLREVIVFEYRVIYRIREKGNLVRIVGVVHGARKLKRHMIE